MPVALPHRSGRLAPTRSNPYVARHVVDAVVDVVCVLCANDAVTVVRELLDRPNITCMYSGTW
jgi:hypothetical protein